MRFPYWIILSTPKEQIKGDFPRKQAFAPATTTVVSISIHYRLVKPHVGYTNINSFPVTKGKHEATLPSRKSTFRAAFVCSERVPPSVYNTYIRLGW